MLHDLTHRTCLLDTWDLAEGLSEQSKLELFDSNKFNLRQYSCKRQKSTRACCSSGFSALFSITKDQGSAIISYTTPCGNNW